MRMLMMNPKFISVMCVVRMVMVAIMFINVMVLMTMIMVVVMIKVSNVTQVFMVCVTMTFAFVMCQDPMRLHVVVLLDQISHLLTNHVDGGLWIS